MTVDLRCGNVLDVLKTMPDESVYCECGCGEPVRGRYHRPGNGGWRVQRFVSPAHALRAHHRVGGWDGQHHTAEAREHISKARHKFYAEHPEAKMTGERNPMYGKRGAEVSSWKGGATPERQAFYSSPEWKQAARIVRARDKGICQRCSKSCKEKRDSHIHHIVSFQNKEIRADPSNLVTLCRDCHRLIHSKGGDVNGAGEFTTGERAGCIEDASR